MTLHDQLCAGLEAHGFYRDEKDRSKYTAFYHPGIAGKKFFVGPNGALRTGVNASSSHSVGDATRRTPVYIRMLEAGAPCKKCGDPRFDKDNPLCKKCYEVKLCDV